MLSNNVVVVVIIVQLISKGKLDHAQVSER